MAVYLAHNATSPPHADVLEAILPFVRNPSSLHGFGGMARSTVESAREDLALLIDCPADPVIFASGGSENVGGIVGIGHAARLARLELSERRHHLLLLRDAFEARLADIPGAVVFASDAQRLPNTTFFALPYYDGETLLMELDRAGFTVASGLTCYSAVTEPGHVMRAMGVDERLASNAMRVCFGMENTLRQVEQLAAVLRQLVECLPAAMRRVAV